MAHSPYHDGDFPDISAYAYDDFSDGYTDSQGIEHRRLLWQHASGESTFEFCGVSRFYPAIVDPGTPANDRPAFYGTDIDDTNGRWERAVIELTATEPIWAARPT